MNERALTPVSVGADTAPDLAAPQPESPGTRLLDALRAGDDRAVVAEIGQTTTVMAENLPWGCRGPDEVDTMLREARERFPGLVFEATARRVGFGLVIEEGRVRDVEAEVTREIEQAEARHPSTPAGGTDDDHPMWDHPDTHPGSKDLVLWREQGILAVAPPLPLNLPVRVTVRHDDLQVHEVRLSFPAALLQQSLGHYVDPLEMSLSQLQSAFIAPAGAGPTTHTLAGPDLASARPAEPAAPLAPAAPRRRRRGVLVLLVLVVLGLVAAAGWWQTREQHGGTGAAAAPQASVSPRVTPAVQPVQQTAARTTASGAPTVTRTVSTVLPSRTPNVTLRSDLAFGFDSSTLSPAAKTAVAHVAQQVRRAGLSGKIYVDGYTDDLGSTSYGMVLSQRRADAVSHYLQSQLLGVPVSIVSVGHGESNPVASNATPAGQQQNRRVTITLPQP